MVHNQKQDQALLAYSTQRKFVGENKRFNENSTMIVHTEFRKPDSVDSKVISHVGSAIIKSFVFKYLDANVDDWTTRALSSARIGGSILLAVVGNVFLIPMVLFYLLIDWNSLTNRLAGMIPPRLRESAGMAGEVDVLGQLTYLEVWNHERFVAADPGTGPDTRLRAQRLLRSEADRPVRRARARRSRD